ncbi:dephospho-CoA kinase domain-containing protein-like [Acropora millepora]|uniref:dephospho-CoA kinase domain-containing protein-like n=1 Tax=Acropora millepora TaxID=45264 RepID=UPI001CF47363|nr:dephospho-CoA kinase domain-containing protein-like [Acropora millepora]
MFIVGITGGVATGKSSVSRVFKDLGCQVVDADEIAREVVEPHKAAWNAIVSNFGKEILLPSGEIDREKLGKIVFEDGVKRRMLNKCTHPSIYKSICWKLFKSFITGEKFVILDLPLLYESGRAVLFLVKYVIVVYSDPSTQLRRLMERNNFNKHDAEKRINSQMPLEEKCKRASFIIDNSSSQERTVEQVKRLHDKFSQSYAHLPLRISLFLVIVSLSWFLYAWLGQ